MNASDTLRAAAEKLREMAKAATDGPWRDEMMDSEGSVVLSGGNTIRTARRPARCGQFADATWIATMSPAVAEPLARILEKEADTIRWAKSWDEVSDGGRQYEKVARLILGEGDGNQG